MCHRVVVAGIFSRFQRSLPRGYGKLTSTAGLCQCLSAQSRLMIECLSPPSWLPLLCEWRDPSIYDGRNGTLRGEQSETELFHPSAASDHYHYGMASSSRRYMRLASPLMGPVPPQGASSLPVHAPGGLRDRLGLWLQCSAGKLGQARKLCTNICNQMSRDRITLSDPLLVYTRRPACGPISINVVQL